jgi:hypothetical protein
MDDLDLSGMLDNPMLNIERQRSYDDSSLSEMSFGGRSGFNTPPRNSFEPHPMVADAWESLRKSLVYFRGEPLGTLAAVDHQSEEVLNYDQVNFFSVLFWAVLCTLIFKHVIHGYNRVIKLQSVKLS